MEMIMSSLALWSADTTVPAVEPKAKPGLFQRLLEVRERGARRHIQAFLNWQSDERLKGFGYTAAEIEAIRQGRLADTDRNCNTRGE
jgi:hypothetical protein